MESIAVGAHIFICLFLIVIVLLQSGKGADIGAVFGGASQVMFGGRGPASFLNKLTIVVSVFFLITAVWLTKIGHHKGTESVIGKVPVSTAPATNGAAAPEAEKPASETKTAPATENKKEKPE